jgi:hypothetical protein
MTPEQFHKAEEIFHRAKDLAADDREAFLDAECGADAELRAKVPSCRSP